MIELYEITEVMNNIDGLSVIVFDLDDTLYSEKEYVRNGYKEIAKIVPQVIDAERKLWHAFEKNKPAIDVVLKNEGIYSEALKERCLNIYRNHEPSIHLYAGVADMLEEIHKSGLDIGIITDGRPEGQRAKIKALGLNELVDHIIVTDELGGVEYRKPNKTAFVKMQEIFGMPFEKMCYIGDNIKKDFIAPKILGMKCIWIRNKDGLYPGL